MFNFGCGEFTLWNNSKLKDDKMFFTYVLESIKDGDKYYGYTKNLELRFEKHKKGLVESTKNRRPLKLIYY